MTIKDLRPAEDVPALASKSIAARSRPRDVLRPMAARQARRDA